MKIACVLGVHFEDSEFRIPYDRLKEEGYQVDVIGLKAGEELPGYKGKGGIFGDFLHCVKTREKCFRDIEVAHRACTVCHLGNIAYWLKRPLKWDPAKHRFDDAQANAMLSRPMRSPWQLDV